MRAPERFRSTLASVAATILAVALMLLATGWFAQRWEAVAATEQMATVRWGWVALAVGLLCIHACSALVIWRRVLASTRAVLPWRLAIDVFTPTLLARYVPGRIWANAARLALAKRAGVAYRQTTGALMWEAGIALGSASVVSAITLHDVLDSNRWRVVAGIAAATLLTGLLLRASGRLPAGLPGTVATAIVGWLLFGAAHFAIAQGIADVALSRFPLISGAMALGWSIGFLAIIVPLGFGVRDAVLLLVLSTMFDAGAGLLFVALARLAQLAADILLTLVWILFRRRAAHPPSS